MWLTDHYYAKGMRGMTWGEMSRVSKKRKSKQQKGFIAKLEHKLRKRKNEKLLKALVALEKKASEQLLNELK